MAGSEHMTVEMEKTDISVRKMVEGAHKQKIFVSKKLDLATIKRNSKEVGASFNEFITAVVLRSTSEFSGGQEDNKDLNVMTLISMNSSDGVDMT